MNKKAIGLVAALTIILAACAPAGTTTAPVTTTAPATGATTTAPVTTKPATEKPQYGGTLNLVLTADISSWDQGLTFC